MLDQSQRDIVKSTAPILKEHGEALTRHFYARMFQHNPELKPVFNQGHQRSGQQQQALAMAVAAYAEHIEDPLVLMPVLNLIAQKHVSLGVRAEHYKVVGTHLIASIREVLGAAAATDALLKAWQAAYLQLTDVLIGLENGLYQQAVETKGGWSGWRAFCVVRKQAETQEVTSFYLRPADGGSVPGYRPGQYVSVRVYVPELGLHQPRQYSLSSAPGQAWLRISVKREDATEAHAHGMVSNVLHERTQEGDVIEVSPPLGDFFLHPDRKTPVVLISAGVGVTPMMSMLEHLAQHDAARPVWFIHACRHGGAHAFREQVQALAAKREGIRTHVYYEHPRPLEPRHTPGRLSLQALQPTLPLHEADFYLCGPRPFMHEHMATLRHMGVSPARIHAEAFSTGGV